MTADGAATFHTVEYNKKQMAISLRDAEDKLQTAERQLGIARDNLYAQEIEINKLHNKLAADAEHYRTLHSAFIHMRSNLWVRIGRLLGFVE